MKKWISIGAVLLLVIGGGIWFLQSKQTTAASTSAQVMTSTVQRGDIEVNISGSGSIASINSNDVTSPSEGIVDEVLVEANQLVSEGEVLVTFTDGSAPITAPHAGTITTLDVESGDRVQLGQVVSHITDYAALQTVITVDELDIASVKEGQEAEITVNAFPDDTFTGKVTKVAKEGTAESGVSSFEVTVQFDEPKDILIGMTTEVSITTNSKQDILYVPIEAVKIDGNKKYVTVQESSSVNAEDAATKQVAVETGINDDKNIEITSGLEEGQVIQLTLQTSTTTSQSSDQRDSMKGMPGAESGFPSGGQGRMGGTPSGGTGKGGE